MTHTQYQTRTRDCFSKAFKLLDEHKHVRSDEDWERFAGTLGRYGNDPSMLDLIVVVSSELERENKEHTEVDLHIDR